LSRPRGASRARRYSGCLTQAFAQWQGAPLRVKAEGEVSLLVNVPVKPTVAVPPGGMVAL